MAKRARKKSEKQLSLRVVQVSPARAGLHPPPGGGHPALPPARYVPSGPVEVKVLERAPKQTRRKPAPMVVWEPREPASPRARYVSSAPVEVKVVERERKKRAVKRTRRKPAPMVVREPRKLVRARTREPRKLVRDRTAKGPDCSLCGGRRGSTPRMQKRGHTACSCHQKRAARPVTRGEVCRLLSELCERERPAKRAASKNTKRALPAPKRALPAPKRALPAPKRAPRAPKRTVAEIRKAAAAEAGRRGRLVGPHKAARITCVTCGRPHTRSSHHSHKYGPRLAPLRRA